MIKIYEIYIPLVEEIEIALNEKIIKKVQSNQTSYFSYIVLDGSKVEFKRYSTSEIELKYGNNTFTIYPEDFDRIEII